MNILLSPYWLLGAAIWFFGNGVLHDIFVIKGHKGEYDRELLRLLMDGHVLILSGIIMFVCYLMVQNKIQYGALIGLITCAFMLLYCIMIFPLLKSIGTIAVSTILIIVCIRLYITFPDIYKVMEKYKETSGVIGGDTTGVRNIRLSCP